MNDQALMNDSARAIAILRKARDILLERLVERVVDSEEAILDDALGHTYGGEIDGLHDQLGLKINHLNAILAAIPHADDSPRPAPVGGAVYEAPQSTSVIAGYLPVPAIEAVHAATEHATEPAAALDRMVEQIACGDLDGATRSLSTLLNTTDARARRCAKTFHSRLMRDPALADKAVELREAVAAGLINAVLVLLWECFSLQGMEALAAFQSLKATIVDRDEP